MNAFKLEDVLMGIAYATVWAAIIVAIANMIMAYHDIRNRKLTLGEHQQQSTKEHTKLSDNLTASNTKLSDKIQEVHTIVVTDKAISEKNYQSLDEKQKDIKDSLGKINDIMKELEKVNAKNMELNFKVVQLQEVLTVEKQRIFDLNENIKNLVADKRKLLNDIDDLKNDRDKDFTIER